MTEDARIIKVAAAVVLDARGRMAVVRKQNTNVFMQPGGKLEPEEPAEICLARELEEELQIDVGPEQLKPLGHFTASAANEPGATVEASLFLVPGRFEAKPAAEIAELRWITAVPEGDIVLAPLTRDNVLPIFAGLSVTDLD